MKVQIYTLQSVEEALEVISVGVDNIGITPASIGLPGEISNETAKDICEKVEGGTKVALSVSSNIDEIIEMVMFVGPDVLHLCGEPGELNTNGVKSLKERLQKYNKELPIMQAISVDDMSALDFAKEYEHISDYFILDTSTTAVQGVGASGNVHDWNVSKAIVESVDIPVILAGGLSSENVQEAISTVHPWGVDSLTHTNKFLDDGSFIKDIEKVREFYINATSK
jgi:phosphoribosylanthranilate isomerase|tara:strand:- start:446 stop:1120 length:675 start_codon:yes stop_codon:yes gene_type:complete